MTTPDLIAELAEVRSKREAWAASPAKEAWNELALLAVNFTAHHAEIEAMARDAHLFRLMFPDEFVRKLARKTLEAVNTHE